MSRRGWDSGAARPRFPRTARVNQVLREVLADELERMEDINERLGLLTITAVASEPDLRNAVVYLSSMSEEEELALQGARAHLQAAISRQLRLKRTPHLHFLADPAVAEGERIEEILRHLPDTPPRPSTRGE